MITDRIRLHSVLLPLLILGNVGNEGVNLSWLVQVDSQRNYKTVDWRERFLSNRNYVILNLETTRVTQSLESCSISRLLHAWQTGLLIYNDIRFQMSVGCQTVWLTDWLSDWLTDRLTDWIPNFPTNGLTEWLTEWLTDWLKDLLTDRLNVWLFDCRTGWTAGLSDRPNVWLFDCLAVWRFIWLFYRLAVWPTDWLIDWPSECLTNGRTGCLDNWRTDCPSD